MTPNRTVKQYQNNDGVVMFIDDREENYKTKVSYCDTIGKKIDNNDDRALTFFSNGPYLVMEFN